MPLMDGVTTTSIDPEEHGSPGRALVIALVSGMLITTKELVARVPAVYLKSAEGTI
jgi:hypothetical protein